MRSQVHVFGEINDMSHYCRGEQKNKKDGRDAASYGDVYGMIHHIQSFKIGGAHERLLPWTQIAHARVMKAPHIYVNAPHMAPMTVPARRSPG